MHINYFNIINFNNTTCRGKDHVVGLELCLRNGGSVAFVMPFMRHDRFLVIDYYFYVTIHLVLI